MGDPRKRWSDCEKLKTNLYLYKYYTETVSETATKTAMGNELKKTCRRCRAFTDISKFIRDKNLKAGLACYYKECYKECIRRYFQNIPTITRDHKACENCKENKGNS